MLPQYSKLNPVFIRIQIKHIAITNCDLFSIIVMSKKSHCTIFVIQNFVQNTKKNLREFHLCCWDHVSKANGVDCFHHEFRVST